MNSMTSASTRTRTNSGCLDVHLHIHTMSLVIHPHHMPHYCANPARRNYHTHKLVCDTPAVKTEALQRPFSAMYSRPNTHTQAPRTLDQQRGPQTCARLLLALPRSCSLPVRHPRRWARPQRQPVQRKAPGSCRRGRRPQVVALRHSRKPQTQEAYYTACNVRGGRVRSLGSRCRTGR